MPKQSAPISRSVFTRNLASKRGSTWRPFVNDVQHKPRRPMRSRTSKKDMKVVVHVFEDDIVVSPPPRGARDLRFTIPDVPANRDLLSFLNTRAHDMMGEVVRELHTVTKIKVPDKIKILGGVETLRFVLSPSLHRTAAIAPQEQ